MPNMLETNVSLLGVQRLKKMSLEHKTHKLTLLYGKTWKKKRTTTLTFLIFEEQNTFLGNKHNSFFVRRVSRKHFLFEELHLFEGKFF